MSLLQLKQVHAGYGEVDILHGIDLALHEREIITIAGTNGAGKSTMSKAVLGLLPRVEGDILLDGQDIKKVQPEARIHCGIGYVPQVNNVFASLTVRENLEVVQRVEKPAERMEEMLVIFPALRARLRSPAGSLSGGERQMLAFARALMSRPRLIVLDEPTAALSPGLVAQVLDLIRTLPEAGVAVFMVEQRARQALAISDRGYILDQGKVVLTGAARALLADDKMSSLYLGNQH